MQKTEGAVRYADITSGIGAGVLGVGLGILIGDELRPIAAILLLIGALLHGWAMWRKHHLQRANVVELPHWSVVLYWICWLTFPALAALVVARSTGGVGA